MSFCVAVQSAIFYYAACTPCNQFLNRRKAKIKARKESEEKARVISEQPHLYQHPDPFHTNPFWSEEIRIGPSLQPKKGRGSDNSRKTASRDLASVGTGSTIAVTPATATTSNTSPQPISSPNPAHAPGIGSSPTIAPEEDAASATLSKTASVSTVDGWNFKRYQREDEELWGYEFSKTGQKLMDAIKQAGTTAGRYVESKLGIEKQVTEEDRYNFYFSPRNPPVNDYHPPIVSSKPIHRDTLRWMLQPPPPAKVMEGKVPVSRTASIMSIGSRRTATSEGMSMGRLVGERALEAKIRNGELPGDEERDFCSTSTLHKVRTRKATTSITRAGSRRTTRSFSMSTESEDSDDEVYQRRSRRPSRRPVVTPDIDSDDSGNEQVLRSLESLGVNSHPSHAAQKPRLPTILSSETTVTVSDATQVSQAQSSAPSVPSASALSDITNASPTPRGNVPKDKGQPMNTLS